MNELFPVREVRLKTGESRTRYSRVSGETMLKDAMRDCQKLQREQGEQEWRYYPSVSYGEV